MLCPEVWKGCSYKDWNPSLGQEIYTVLLVPGNLKGRKGAREEQVGMGKGGEVFTEKGLKQSKVRKGNQRQETQKTSRQDMSLRIFDVCSNRNPGNDKDVFYKICYFFLFKRTKKMDLNLELLCLETIVVLSF